MTDFFADTYALFAALQGAPAYAEQFEARRGATTALNVVEFAYGLRRRDLAAHLPSVLPPVLDLVVQPPHSVVDRAARFKAERREAGAPCSYVDAWGYATARWLDVPFLTGDDDFRGVPGVRFLKA